MNYGNITKLNAWKNKKGYFVGIDKIDYMFYGNPNVGIGDAVEFETGKSSPDGKPTLKTLYRIPIESGKDYYDTAFKPNAIAPSKEARQYVEEVKARYQPTDKDATITRLACIKAAAELTSAMVGEPAGLEAIRQAGGAPKYAIEVARKFEKYAKEG